MFVIVTLAWQVLVMLDFCVGGPQGSGSLGSGSAPLEMPAVLSWLIFAVMADDRALASDWTGVRLAADGGEFCGRVGRSASAQLTASVQAGVQPIAGRA